MPTWHPEPRSDTTTEIYSRDWAGSKGPAVPGLSVNAHDYVDLSYDGEGNISDVKYYIGGPQGLLVTHLILTWQGGLLKSVRRLNLQVPTNPAYQA